MATLNEYLGGLINSITDARVMADLQTAQVAEQYAKHDLLRHFSIPRMRIADIELTIPIAIEGLSERTELQLDPVGNAPFKSIMAKELSNSIGYSELPPEPADRLRAVLDTRSEVLIKNVQERGAEESSFYFAKEIVSELFKIIEEFRLGKGQSTDDYSFDQIYQRVQRRCVTLVKGVVNKPVLDQLSVIAESYRLREQRPEDIIRIRVKVSEDGMEWQTLSREDGSIERKLLPE